jgi:hypothetical protein
MSVIREESLSNFIQNESEDEIFRNAKKEEKRIAQILSAKRWQFNQHFRSSFCLHRSQMRKKTLMN